MPNRNQSQDSSPKRPKRAPPCCRCNGINARCKFCACAKAGRACTCCLPAKHGKCSNRPTLFHDSTSTLTMVSSQPLPGSTACSPGPRQLSSSQPILRQLQVPSGPLAPVLSSDHSSPLPSTSHQASTSSSHPSHFLSESSSPIPQPSYSYWPEPTPSPQPQTPHALITAPQVRTLPSNAIPQPFSSSPDRPEPFSQQLTDLPLPPALSQQLPASSSPSLSPVSPAAPADSHDSQRCASPTAGPSFHACSQQIQASNRRHRQRCIVEDCPEYIAPTMWRSHMLLHAQGVYPGEVPRTWLVEQNSFICSHCRHIISNSRFSSHSRKCTGGGGSEHSFNRKSPTFYRQICCWCWAYCSEQNQRGLPSGVRPIAVGETLRRLAGKCVCAILKDKFADFFHPLQYGVACRAGAEKVIHQLSTSWCLQLMQMMNVLAYCYRPGSSMMGFLQVAVLQCFERCIYIALDPLGHHAVSCRHGGDVVIRHNRLRNIIADFCRRAHLSVRIEVGRGLLGTHNYTRPADVLVDGWDRAKPAAFDVTVTSPLTPVTLNEASINEGAAALAAETRKHAANDARCQALGWSCIPLAVETFGNWGREAQGVFSRLATLLALHQGRSKSTVVRDIYGHLSISLVRSVARSIMGREIVH
eukprot:Em0006g1076a